MLEERSLQQSNLEACDDSIEQIATLRLEGIALTVNIGCSTAFYVKLSQRWKNPRERKWRSYLLGQVHFASLGFVCLDIVFLYIRKTGMTLDRQIAHNIMQHDAPSFETN